MEIEFKNLYKIKLATKNDDEDFLKALRIYNDETPPEIKTDTNEIRLWIDNKDASVDFSFFVFILYLDKEVIGFSQISFFQKIKTAFIDYMTFKKDYKVNTAFFPCLSLIQTFMKENNYNADYWITEINNKGNGEKIDTESVFLRKLISLENFGAIDIDYYQPSLGNENFESAISAKLYIKSESNRELKELNKETVLTMIKTIYYSYYFQWYKVILPSEDLEKYRKELDLSFAKIEKSISTDPIKISLTFYESTSHHDSQTTAGPLPAKSSKKKFLYPVAFVGLALFLPLLIFLVYRFILNYFGVQTDALINAFGPAIAACLTALITIWTTTKIKKD